MTPALLLILAACMVGTAFLSGLFGMAGGMILIGILLAIMPLPDAMAVHAVTQMASNGWRCLLWWRYVRPRAIVGYLLGCLVALLAWSFFRYVPSKPVAMLFLGLLPFGVRFLPHGFKPNPESLGHGVIYGSICMALLLLTGVAGPLIDTFFLGGNLDRREMVASKSACQIFGHAMKLVYFGGIVEQAGAVDGVTIAVAIAMSILGTTAARRFLEAMSDTQYRTWAGRIIVSISGYYVIQGAYLLIAPGL
jgi:uncharacterized protein